MVNVAGKLVQWTTGKKINAHFSFFLGLYQDCGKIKGRFDEQGGNFVIEYERLDTHLSVPWHNVFFH